MLKLNKKEVIFGNFPNGEAYLPVQVLNTRAYNKIIWLYQGDYEFFQLALLQNYLLSQMQKSVLEVLYLPHSRMDRTNDDYAVSLFTSANLINSMGFDQVLINEPHSDVSLAVVDHSSAFPWCAFNIDKVIKSCGTTSLFFPDAGAAKRYNFEKPYAVGHKLRDFKTGTITAFQLTGTVWDKVLIVDDMCSKGGTFVHSSKLLKECGAKHVYLMVSYCENTVFEGELFNHIDILFTAKENILSQQHKQIILI